MKQKNQNKMKLSVLAVALPGALAAMTSVHVKAQSGPILWDNSVSHNYEVASGTTINSGATSFTTQGAAGNSNTGVLVLGATLAPSQNLTVAARYTLEAARGYTAQTADVRLRYQF